jgi:oligopeptide transport system permease protein
MRMLRFLFKRLALTVVTLWTLFTLTFFLMRAVPGDPLMKSKEIPAETMKNLRARYGLDRPLLDQYFIQMKNIFIEGNFGTSFRTVGREVNDIIAQQFPVSATVGVVSVSFGVLIGLSLGMLAAHYRNTGIDRAAMLLCVLGIALPSYLFAYLFQYSFAVYPLTVLGFNPESWLRPTGWGLNRDLVLPCLTVSLAIVASNTRLMRAQMVDVSFADFIKTAKAKGASTKRVVFLHQLRNAILPILSVLGPQLVFAMAGSLVVENIYGVPGLGRAYLTSIQNSDYNVIMGLTVFFGGFFILMNLATDILYGLVDPRIRVE